MTRTETVFPMSSKTAGTSNKPEFKQPERLVWGRNPHRGSTHQYRRWQQRAKGCIFHSNPEDSFAFPRVNIRHGIPAAAIEDDVIVMGAIVMNGPSAVNF